MPIKAGYLLLAGGGGVFVWSGIAGKSVSGVFRQLAGGDSPTSAANANSITGVSPLSASADVPIPGAGGSTPASGGTQPASGTAGKMLSYALAQRGKPYSESNPGRFGPSEFDCSGLIWSAARHAGLAIPGGPSNPAAAIVDPELQWFAKLDGSTVITDVSKVQSGDVIGFVGADPNTLGTSKLLPNGKLQVGSAQVQSAGHIGICSSSTEYMSAYDTASGCLVNPISGDQFVVAVRIT